MCFVTIKFNDNPLLITHLQHACYTNQRTIEINLLSLVFYDYNFVFLQHKIDILILFGNRIFLLDKDIIDQGIYFPKYGK